MKPIFSRLLSACLFTGAIAMPAFGQTTVETPPAAPAGTGEAVLHPRFYPGKVYAYIVDTGVIMQAAALGSGQPEQRVNMSHHARLQVGERPAESGTGVAIQASTTRLTLNVEAGKRKLSFDSEQEAASQQEKVLSEHFRSALKQTLELELDESGAIVKARESKIDPSAFVPGLPQFGPDELKQLVAGMVQGFPSKPVKPGDDWIEKGTRSLGEFGEIDFEMTYRYVKDEEFEGALCAVIEYTGELKGDVSVIGEEAKKIAFEGTKMKGQLIFDKLRNTVRLSEQTVDLMVDAPKPDGSGTVKVPIKQSMATRLVSVHDAP